MTKRVLFIGTSFLGAIKQGYDSVSNNDCSATFLGLSAPDLAANLVSGWSVKDGFLILSKKLNCFVSGQESITQDKIIENKTFPDFEKVSGLIINIRNYDAIVFVDMFYRLRPIFSINENNLPLLNKVPVSDELISELKVNGLNGWISINNHSQYGHIPFINVKLFLTTIMQASSISTIYLISAPRPPKDNFNIKSRFFDVGEARRSFDYLEYFYSVQLSKYGIVYLPQPSDILDENGCLTRMEFSRGSHPTKAGVADEHMNQKYGELIINKYADKLI